jgi:signal transduction histidine kinase
VFVAIPTSQLAAELSHDMSVPLTAIIANLEMLEEELGENPDPVMAILVSRSARAASRMQRMLDQYMLGDHTPGSRTPVEVDLHEVANQLAVDSAQLLELAGARLDVRWLPVVQADPDAMYSVLQNLLTNAVKHARPDVCPRLSIAGSQVQAGWRISMTDNGIGIPTQRRMDVFTPFTRANPHVEGHGIGLGAVARIVHAHGGRVGADEAPGGGADVWFELPASSHA